MADWLDVDALVPLLDLAATDPDLQVGFVALDTAARFPLDPDALAQLIAELLALQRHTTAGSPGDTQATALLERLRAVRPKPAAAPFDAAAVAGQISDAVDQLMQSTDTAARLVILATLGAVGDRLGGRTSAPTRGRSRGVPVQRAAPPPQPEARRVQLRLLQGGARRQSFLAGAEHVVRCWIGPLEDGEVAADRPIPDVPMPADGLLLQAQLYWQDGRGVDHSDSRTMLLPAERDARSGDCNLHLTVPEGERYVSADLVFRYRGRIFEAVRLEGFVLRAGEPETPAHTLSLRVQASRREVLGIADSPAVDGTLVIDAPPSPTADAAARLLLFDARGAHTFDLGSSGTALRWLNDTLHLTETVVVRKQARAGLSTSDELDPDDPAVLNLLRTLARHGANLYNQLHDSGYRDPGERLQLLNRTSEHVPLEFVYDRGAPAEDATLCAGWRDALQSDAAGCPVCSRVPLADDQRDRVPVVCPLGFWSLQKVIERLDPDAASSAGASVPTAARRSLRPIDSALFACSDKVPEADREQLWAALTQSVAHPVRAADWVEWKTAVQSDPALLLVLPHHDVDQGLDYLEIGAEGLSHAQARLGREQLLPSYINPDATDPGPIVLMLGCQTAADADGGMGYVALTRRVQQQRAAIVLGTLAKVLGRHAAPVAQELVRQLAAVRDADTDFGTVMRRVRRRMLGRGYLMALCLVTLGDAQWRLAPQQDTAAPVH